MTGQAEVWKALPEEAAGMPAAHPPLVLPPGAPSGGALVSLLGVDYVHWKTSDGGDLYLTRFGAPVWRHLLLENWFAPEWFEAERQRLCGTGTVYKLPTRPVNGRSLNLVVKWSRVGEDVPLDTLTVNKFIRAEFNSPFEEFSLLMELRQGDAGPAGIRIRTQLPLAIYVPSQRLQLWQTGRSEHKIRAIVARHPGVEIDILRQYVVVYGWIKGLDAVETAECFGWGGPKSAEFLAQVTSLVIHELRQKGYHVIDMKPAHIILRPTRGRKLLRDWHGQLAYALVDYELLERTPEHEQAVRSANRKLYLTHMARRFEADAAKPMPDHLRATSLLEVDFIFGRAESTGGLLWVVGRDPDLFNYFLPERWRRTPNKKLSPRNQVFYTFTKDNIHLVWRVSRLGDRVQLKKDGAILEPARRPRLQQPLRGILPRPASEPSRHQDHLSPRHLHDRQPARVLPRRRRRPPLLRPGPSPHAGRRAGHPHRLRLHHHLGILERAGHFARGPRRLFLLLPQRATGLYQWPHFQPDDGPITGGEGRQACPLRTGRPPSQA